MTRNRVAALIAAASCFVLAACGGGAATSSNTDGATTYGGPKGGKVTAADVAVAQRFVGGTSGKATKSPIYVGLVSNTAGPIPPPPGGRFLVKGAIRFFNEKLGGVQGHPIVFKSCTTGASDEQAQACGQQFLNDPSIKAVFNPGLPSGGLALLGAIGGKKLEICVIALQADLFGTNVFCPGGGTMAASSAITYLTSKPNIKTVAQLLPDADLFRQIAQAGLHQMKVQGLDAKLGLVPQNSPDVTSAVIASGARTADALDVTLVSPGQCIAVAKALKTLNVPESVPVVSLSTCINPAVVKALGDLPHWTYFDMGESPYLPNPSPAMLAMLNANTTYGNGQTGAWSAAEFGTALWMGKVFNAVGPDNLTTAALAAEAKKFRGPMFLGDPNIQFGRVPWRNTGTLTGRFYTYEGHGKWVDATGGKYLPSPPPAN